MCPTILEVSFICLLGIAVIGKIGRHVRFLPPKKKKKKYVSVFQSSGVQIRSIANCIQPACRGEAVSKPLVQILVRDEASKFEYVLAEVGLSALTLGLQPLQRLCTCIAHSKA